MECKVVFTNKIKHCTLSLGFALPSLRDDGGVGRVAVGDCLEGGGSNRLWLGNIHRSGCSDGDDTGDGGL